MSVIQYNALSALIKKGITGGFLLLGDEEYLKNYWKRQLTAAAVSDPSNMFNRWLLNAESYTPQALKDAIEALPSFADRKTVELSGISPVSMRESELDELCAVLSIIPEHPETTVIMHCTSDELPYVDTSKYVQASDRKAAGAQTKLASVLNDHPGAVNTFVAHPCRLKFCRIKISDDLCGPFLYMDNIELLGKFRSLLKRLSALSDIQAAERDFFIFTGGDRQQIDHRYFTVYKMLLRVIVQFSGRTVRHTECLLHSADRTEHVGLVDHLSPACSYEDILGIICHSHHFVRHDLADRKDHIVAAVHQKMVHFNVDLLREQTFADLRAHFRRHIAENDRVCLPVMDKDPVSRHCVAKELVHLLLAHWHVRAERRHDIHLNAAFIFLLEHSVNDLCDGPGIRIASGVIRRYNKDFPKIRELRQHLSDHLFQLLSRDHILFFCEI